MRRLLKSAGSKEVESLMPSWSRLETYWQSSAFKADTAQHLRNMKEIGTRQEPVKEKKRGQGSERCASNSSQLLVGYSRLDHAHGVCQGRRTRLVLIQLIAAGDERNWKRHPTGKRMCCYCPRS